MTAPRPTSPVRLTTLLAGLCLLVATLAAVAPAPASATPFVARAQRRLADLGCWPGRTDGTLDQHTRSAVIRFQSANGLAQDAHLTAATRRQLDAAHPVRCDRRPVPRRTGHGRRVVVSQRQNYLWLVRAGGGVVAQGPMVDNTAVLRPGSHRVASYCGRPARVRDNSDASGTLRLPWFTRFAPCGVGFHRIPLSRATGAQIHPDWLLGTNLATSHGCLRLSRRTAVAVWRFATVGTPVVVVR